MNYFHIRGIFVQISNVMTMTTEDNELLKQFCEENGLYIQAVKTDETKNQSDSPQQCTSPLVSQHHVSPQQGQ